MDTIPEIKENINLNIEFPVMNSIFLNLPKEFWKEPDELKVKSIDGYHYIKKCKYNKYFDYLHYITENYYF